MTKALVLFSGGLDSRLTIKILQEQNLDVEAVYIKLPFGKGCCTNLGSSLKFAQEQKVKLHIIDASKGKLFKEYLKLLKNPKFKTGSGINPCQDCKIFLFKQAKKLAKEIKAEIIATGEVLGQRPMSQMKKALIIDEEEAGLKNKILRPLSAKLLPETTYEKKGLIDRNKLLKIRGRRRIEQMDLAKRYKIDYPGPAGGCVLCEKDLKNRFNQLLKRGLTEEQATLSTIGRHFIIKDSWIILGRNQKENDILENTKTGKIILPEKNGPTAKYFGKIEEKEIKELIEIYSKKDNLDERKKFDKFLI